MKPTQLFFLLFFLSVVSAFPQTNLIISPEILPDHRVTFRIGATNAQKVGIFVDWMKTGGQEALTKDDSGIWSITLGPVSPGIYVYNFIVDGLPIADPVNPKVKLRARTSASLLEVPGITSEYWEARDVPHGTVQINFHKSSVLGNETREVWVYTPPGYEQNRSKTYPVLYLLHGSNDTPAGWTTAAHANFTMDNLLAEGRAREMIIVTPFGHAVRFGSRNGNNTELFEKYLLNDVIPMIEAKYRIASGRTNHGIAGFSMGGGHALHIGLGHLELFGAVAALSPGVPQDFEKQFASLLAEPNSTNKKLELLWIACGKDDSLFPASQKLSTTLTQHGIKHIYRPTEGAHTFNVWREYFHEFAPLLFHSQQ